MNENQQIKLKALREKYVGDPASVKYIADLEKELEGLMIGKDLVEEPIFKAIETEAQKRIDAYNTLLLNDKTLTADQRARIMDIRDLWIFVFQRFGMSINNDAIDRIERIIDEELVR